MLNKKLMFGGGVTPPEGCIHFKTSKAMDGVNFFSNDPDYDFSSLQVYINDELTDIPANALIAAKGDDIRIVSLSKPYPFFYRGGDYIASIEEPLPFMDKTYFNNYFFNCKSLISIPENLFINNPQITSFYFCFYGCKSLTSIPVALFNNNTKVTDFSYCFYLCENLTVNVQIGSTTTSSVNVDYFAGITKEKGTVYCKEGSAAYTAFSKSINANVNVRTY